MAKTDYYCRKHGPTYEPNYGWGPAGPRCRVCSGEHQQRVAGCELRLQIAEDMAASETKPAGVVGAPAPKQPAPIVDFQIAADTAKSETKPAGATAPKQPALDATLAECGSRYG
ncbi:MAG: hypothetical protein KGJ45_11940, partial [Elusimicrobia bacterium]|nr:hypothetical protein [Elusimicrobiota bacterium]